MVFACSSTPGERTGLRLIKGEVDGIVERLGIPAQPDRRPLYFAEGPYVVRTHNRERMDIRAAFAEAQRLLIKAASATIEPSLADAYRDELNTLIDVIREADGNRPRPPAQAARAAA
ncbi:hypothetical protein [Brevundimonas viscosa]|uniref:Uncharacterized protein n=1 Tax=Brevundimonas viscosa TaxID=871741 RepID=A0A1I6PRU9_9CAUL|nr:hypothetical protein [Brevundimonas viscosa]SFS42765.1 hypothetical protein SAMN05192570_1211 [Brevundimonas viscosa]